MRAVQALRRDVQEVYVLDEQDLNDGMGCSSRLRNGLHKHGRWFLLSVHGRLAILHEWHPCAVKLRLRITDFGLTTTHIELNLLEKVLLQGACPTPSGVLEKTMLEPVDDKVPTLQ